MSLVSLIKGLFNKNEETAVEKVYVCPKCGSTKIGYSSTIGNFIEFVQDNDRARYVKQALCMDCGFKSQGKLGDESDNYLKPFERIKDERNS